MVKLGFLFPGPDCMMPHTVQGSIDILNGIIVDFWESIL